jgi:hypothetical protein
MCCGAGGAAGETAAAGVVLHAVPATQRCAEAAQEASSWQLLQGGTSCCCCCERHHHATSRAAAATARWVEWRGVRARVKVRRSSGRQHQVTLIRCSTRGKLKRLQVSPPPQCEGGGRHNGVHCVALAA